MLPENQDHKLPEARDIADRLMACFGSMLLYWYHFSHSGRRIDVETDDDSIGGHFLHLLHGRKPPASSGCGRCTPRSSSTPSTSSTHRPSPRASSPAPAPTCIRRSPARIGALRGPKHGGANEFAFDVIEPLRRPRRRREADIVRRIGEKQVIIGFGHPVYTIADPRNEVIKTVAKRLSKDAGDMKLFDISERIEQVMCAREEDVRQPRLVQRRPATT